MTTPNDKPGSICTWMGKDIEELTRDELLIAIRHLGRQLNDAHEKHQRTLRMWEVCREKVR